MKRLFHPVFVLLLLSVLSAQAVSTFGDLAVWTAKGYFKNYVARDASLEECAAFLNSKGICFSIFDLMDSDVAVTQEDFARAVGQSELLFLGEAEVVKGCIKKPSGIETWVDYCLLNDVSLPDLWKGFLQQTENGSLPEVRRFFGDYFEKGEEK